MKTNLKNILSIVILSIFIFSALSSLNFGFLDDFLFNHIVSKNEFLGNRTQKITRVISIDTFTLVNTQIGRYDLKGRWAGTVSNEAHGWNRDSAFQVNREWTDFYIEGKRHGKSVHYYKKTPPGDLRVDTICYNMGKKVNCEDFAELRDSEIFANDIFIFRYPITYFDYVALGYNNHYIKRYMDTLQSIINDFDFDETKFDDYYSDATDILSETPFDSLIRLNSDFFLINLVEFFDEATFRLAVFDRYLTDHEFTFDVIKTLYPDFIKSMGELDIIEADLQSYCMLFDSLLSLNDPIYIEDDLFPHDLDSLIYKTFNEIEAMENDAIMVVQESIILHSVREFFYDADPIRESQREAYLLTNEIIMPPVLTTTFNENLPDNRAEVEGFVVSNGGGSIKERGIVWAQYNNPTIEDEMLMVEGSLGQFSVIIPDLVPGAIYFARSYAKNEHGVSYGNNTRFIAETVSPVEEEILISEPVFSVYPNPVSSVLNVKFEQQQTGNVTIDIVDISGKTVLSYPNMRFKESQESLALEVSGLLNGMYHCIVMGENGERNMRKFMVMHQ